MTRFVLVSVATVFAVGCAALAGIEEFERARIDVSMTDAGPLEAAAPDAVTVVDAPVPPTCTCDGGERCHTDGRCYPRLLATGLVRPTGLGVRGTTIIWAEDSELDAADGQLKSLDVAVGAPAPVALATDLRRPRLAHAGPASFPVGFQWSMSEESNVWELSATGTLEPFGELVQVSTGVTNADYVVSFANGMVRIARRAPASETIINTLESPKLAALVGAELFWAVGDTVRRCSLPNCGRLTSDEPTGEAIAAMVGDSERAWLLLAGNAVDRVVDYSTDGTKATPLAVGRATNIAAGPSKVFVGHPGEAIRALDKASRQLVDTPYQDAKLLTSDGEFLYWITSQNELFMGPQ